MVWTLPREERFQINKFEDLIQKAKDLDEGIDFLTRSLCNLEAPLSELVPTVSRTRHEQHESFIGCTIPDQVYIRPPTDIHSKGRSKRIIGWLDKGNKNDKGQEKNNQAGKKKKNEGGKKKKEGDNQRVPRKCKICKQVVLHDSGNCLMKS